MTQIELRDALNAIMQEEFSDVVRNVTVTRAQADALLDKSVVLLLRAKTEALADEALQKAASA